MQFERKTITILDEDRKPVEVTAWQGVGTGLAYHHPIYKDHPSGEEFILVHVPTGMCMTKLTLPTEPEARAFLVAVAALDPDQWGFDLDEYIRRYNETGRVLEMCNQIEAMYHSALIPRDSIYLYAEDADGDPVNGETYDVASEDPEDTHNKEYEAQIFNEYRSAVRVMLTRIEVKTGKHTDLHTYERSTTVVVQS